MSKCCARARPCRALTGHRLDLGVLEERAQPPDVEVAHANRLDEAGVDEGLEVAPARQRVVRQLAVDDGLAVLLALGRARQRAVGRHVGLKGDVPLQSGRGQHGGVEHVCARAQCSRA